MTKEDNRLNSVFCNRSLFDLIITYHQPRNLVQLHLTQRKKDHREHPRFKDDPYGLLYFYYFAKVLICKYS